MSETLSSITDFPEKKVENKPNTSNTNSLSSIKEFLILLAVFLTPFAFLPFFTFPYFEMSKFLVIAIITLVATVIHLVQGIVEGKLKFRFNSYTSIVVFLVISFLVTVWFSPNKLNALFGDFGVPFTGTLGFFTFIFLYLMILSTNVKSKINLLLSALLGGQMIASVLFLLSYFANDLIPFNSLKAYGYSVSGTPTSMSVIGVVSTLLAIVLITSAPKILNKILLAVTIIVNLAVVVIINWIGAWVALAVGVLYLLIKLDAGLLKKNFEYITASIIIGAALGIASYMPVTQKALGIDPFPQNTSITATESWSIMLDGSKAPTMFMFGTGPSQYLPSFTVFKPISVNSTDYWAQRFLRPYNEIFYQVNSLGVVGVGLMALIAVLVMFSVIRTKRDDVQGIALGAGILALGVPLLFGNANTSWIAIIVIMFAMYSVYTKGTKNMEIKLNAENPINYLAPLAIIVIVGILSYGAFILYAADFSNYKGAKALASGDTTMGVEGLVKAANTFPARDTYHRNLANLNLLAAQNVNASEDLSEEEKLQRLVDNLNSAVQEAEFAVSQWSTNVNNWELLGNVRFGAAQLLNDKNNPEVVLANVRSALDAISTAARLDPKNPILQVSIGNIYLQVGDFESALQFFTAGANLKPDYAQARFSRGLALEGLENYVLAEEEYLIAKNILSAQGSEDLTGVDAKLTEVSPKANKQREEILAEQQKQLQAQQQAVAEQQAQQQEEVAQQSIPAPEVVTNPAVGQEELVDPTTQPIENVTPQDLQEGTTPEPDQDTTQ